MTHEPNPDFIEQTAPVEQLYDPALNDPALQDAASKAIELAQRRELVAVATGHIAAILGEDVSIGKLIDRSESEDDVVRIPAKRALRVFEALADPNSKIMAVIPESQWFDYAEAVVTYGASDSKYLELMERHELDAPATTAVFDIREQLNDICGANVGFPVIEQACKKLGWTLKDASIDPERFVQALDENGLLIDHIGNSERSTAFAGPRLVVDQTFPDAAVQHRVEEFEDTIVGFDFDAISARADGLFPEERED